jgi:hypothetical protein
MEAALEAALETDSEQGTAVVGATPTGTKQEDEMIKHVNASRTKELRRRRLFWAAQSVGLVCVVLATLLLAAGGLALLVLTP